jgi:hypothetical protein
VTWADRVFVARGPTPASALRELAAILRRVRSSRDNPHGD